MSTTNLHRCPSKSASTSKVSPTDAVLIINSGAFSIFSVAALADLSFVSILPSVSFFSVAENSPQENWLSASLRPHGGLRFGQSCHRCPTAPHSQHSELQGSQLRGAH